TFLTPRNRNWRKPRACLICPNTGSTTCFLNRYGVSKPPSSIFLRISCVSGPPTFPFAAVGCWARFDLRAIQCDVTEFDQPCCLTQLQNLQEQLAERLQMALTEVADRSEVRRIKRNNHHEIVP